MERHAPPRSPARAREGLATLSIQGATVGDGSILLSDIAAVLGAQIAAAVGA